MREVYMILKMIRNHHNLTQKEFSNRIGMKQSAYSMIESGKNQPSYDLLSSVVKEFRLDANVFFSPTKDDTSESLNIIRNDNDIDALDDNIFDSSVGDTGQITDEEEVKVSNSVYSYISDDDMNKALLTLTNSQLIYLKFHLSDIQLNLKLLQEKLMKVNFNRTEYEKQQQTIMKIANGQQDIADSGYASNKALIEGLLGYDEAIKIYLDSIRDISKNLYLHNSY